MNILSNPRVSHLSIARNEKGLFDFAITVDAVRVKGLDFETVHEAYEAILTRAFVEAPAIAGAR